MAYKDKSVRASQLITPFGVGAVLELGGESFTCNDISKWPSSNCVKLAENNLERVLRKEIRRPPTEEQGAAVPFSRFPRWLFCSSCRRLHNHTYTADRANEFKSPKCSTPSCGSSSLVPMRFVVVCEHGHMQDVDWFWWTHRDAQAARTGQCARQTANLTFKTSGASGGDFNAMSIECSCGSKQTLEGLTDRPYPRGCDGRQPWQRIEDRVACSAVARVHPRGASNVYYPVSLSALDIGADALAQQVGKEEALRVWLENFEAAKGVKAAVAFFGDGWRGQPQIYDYIVNEGCRQFELPRDAVKACVLAYLEGKAGSGGLGAPQEDQSQFSFFVSEWPYLARPVGIQTEHLRTQPIALNNVWPAAFASLWDQVTLIHRLREVRALLGFRRLKPDTESTLVPVDLGQDAGWLPGVDTFGEGIFLRFSEGELSKWESALGNVLASRMETLKLKCERWGREPAIQYASPRFVALHTIAHGLIRRLSFDAGYSSSSLRERIYSRTGTSPMAGILIYTSEGDSEGSLGGLVRQGQPERLLGTMMRAIADLQWCSADPVCSEMTHQGVDGMNAAACHSCSLVSETSCIFNNSLLDRRLLFGAPSDGIEGLLDAVAHSGAV